MGFTALFVLALAGGVLSDDPTLNPFVELKSGIEFLSSRDSNLAESAYRLLDTVQPHHVYVDLDVYLGESRFDGVVTHLVTVQEALSQIVLHSNVVEILSVSIFNSANQPVPLNLMNPFELDSYFEIIKIHLGSTIQPGDYTITISYKGKINENPVDRGFYKGYYHVNNQKIYYATTQFQPFHARKAFPCFDEPQFKSRFVISITRDANLSPSYSNMAINQTVNVGNNRIRETFLPTPIISSYLIAFHVSDFEETTSTATESKPFGIISRRGVTNQHAYAAQIGFAVTDELSGYLANDYYSHGIDVPMKNDHIALPDFPSGAMENWGMVNYREAYLLYDPANTNLVNKINIATIMAHEMAHKWFGNLVTCFWWSNLWLNESYASFFEYFAVHMADDNLELADQFVVDQVHSALNSDASSGATSMNLSSVETNPSISGHFGTTSYAKGASVLRMLEHFVGPRSFRNALRYYLRDNAYGLGEPIKMYDAFRQAVSEDPSFAERYPNIDIGAVFDSWVQNPGSPVLNVNVNMNTGDITITQERFLLSGATPPNHIWQVPVSWTSGRNPNFASTTPAFVLTGRTTTIQNTPGHDWVILNVAQSGLYRVNYDSHNWEMIASALRENVNSIHYLNRAQIVNDVLHFIRADKISFDLAFEVLSFLEFETNYYVWAGALGQIDIIRRRLEHVPQVQAEFHTYLLKLMDRVIEQLGYTDVSTDSTSTILNRMQIMNYACNFLGHQGCVDYAKERWQQYRASENNLVHPSERRYVYCVGLREGNAADYNWLYEKYNSSQNTADMVVMLRALGCTKDPASLRHYMEQSMYNDRIRIHDKPNTFTYALQGNPENIDVVLEFLYNRYSEIPEWYGGAARLNTGISAISTYLTDWEKIEQFHEWTFSNQVALGDSFSTARAVIRTATANREWGTKIAPDFYSILRSRNSAVSLTTSVVLLVATAIAHLLR